MHPNERKSTEKNKRQQKKQELSNVPKKSSFPDRPQARLCAAVPLHLRDGGRTPVVLTVRKRYGMSTSYAIFTFGAI